MRGKRFLLSCGAVACMTLILASTHKKESEPKFLWCDGSLSCGKMRGLCKRCVFKASKRECKKLNKVKEV